MNTISVEELEKIDSSKITIVDVRPADQYRAFLYAPVVYRNIISGSQCKPVPSGYGETFGQYSVYGTEVIISRILERVVHTDYY